MSRCTNSNNLEVHHKRRDGGNGIDNAIVLCSSCHSKTATYGVSGKSPEPFDQLTKTVAMITAKYRCECTMDICVH